MIKIKTLGISLSVVTALSFSGCGSSSNDDTKKEDEITTKNYNGAGSRWDMSFKSNGIATIKELNSNLEINATWETLSSGFRKITTTSSSDSNIANGTVTYGFNLPDYMFPFISFTENKLIPTIVKGECPNGDLKHNFIVSYAKSNNKTDNTINDFDGFGTFGYWHSNSNTNKTNIEVYKRDGSRPDDGGSYEISGTPAANCSNGTIYDTVGDITDDWNADTTAYFTKSGGLIWHQEGKGNIVGNAYNNRIENDFMLPYEADLNTINQIDGNYIGYEINGNGQASLGYENNPVSVIISNGTLTVKNINVNTNVVGSELSEFTLNTEVNGTKGLWKASNLSVDSTGSEGIGCAIDLDAGGSGKNVVICGGMKPDGTLKKLYSLILVSK